MTDTDRLAEIKARDAQRHHNSEDHSPIDVHKTIDGFVVPEMLHRLCIECSDVDTIEALENGDLIDSADGVVFPCAAADVDWLVAEVERLRARLTSGLVQAPAGGEGAQSVLWQHACGHVEDWPRGEAPDSGGCDACESGSPDVSDWQPLLMLPRNDPNQTAIPLDGAVAS